jgi:hypothetical protein
MGLLEKHEMKYLKFIPYYLAEIGGDFVFFLSLAFALIVQLVTWYGFGFHTFHYYVFFLGVLLMLASAFMCFLALLVWCFDFYEMSFKIWNDYKSGIK